MAERSVAVKREGGVSASRPLAAPRTLGSAQHPISFFSPEPEVAPPSQKHSTPVLKSMPEKQVLPAAPPPAPLLSPTVGVPENQTVPVTLNALLKESRTRLRPTIKCPLSISSVRCKALLATDHLFELHVRRHLDKIRESMGKSESESEDCPVLHWEHQGRSKQFITLYELEAFLKKEGMDAVSHQVCIMKDCTATNVSEMHYKVMHPPPYSLDDLRYPVNKPWRPKRPVTPPPLPTEPVPSYLIICPPVQPATTPTPRDPEQKVYDILSRFPKDTPFNPIHHSDGTNLHSSSDIYPSLDSLDSDDESGTPAGTPAKRPPTPQVPPSPQVPRRNRPIGPGIGRRPLSGKQPYSIVARKIWVTNPKIDRKVLVVRKTEHPHHIAPLGRNPIDLVRDTIKAGSTKTIEPETAPPSAGPTPAASVGPTPAGSKGGSPTIGTPEPSQSTTNPRKNRRKTKAEIAVEDKENAALTKRRRLIERAAEEYAFLKTGQRVGFDFQEWKYAAIELQAKIDAEAAVSAKTSA